MLKNWFSRPLTLTVEGVRVTFNTVTDFDFAISSRVEVPGAKVTTLVRLSPEALKREAQNIRRVEKSFVDVLAKSLQDPGAIGSLLLSLDTQNFSNDHHWREIVMGVREQSSVFDEHKQLALVKYMQYLAARQDVLKSIYYDKRKYATAGPVSEAENGVESALRETVIFDAERDADESYTQLPRGETVEVQIGPSRQLPIKLSRHRFQLVPGEPFALLDTAGAEFPLRSGKNILGRFHGNHIVLNAGYRDVSRKHLVVEPVDADRVRLTDLSAHGTFVPSAYLSSPGRRSETD